MDSKDLAAEAVVMEVDLDKGAMDSKDLAREVVSEDRDRTVNLDSEVVMAVANRALDLAAMVLVDM